MKSSLKGLGMKYKSIHAYKFDCILYRKEHKHRLKCPVYNEPRYVQKIILNSKQLVDTKVPHKLLKYFPLRPRLIRLYTVRWIAEVGGDLMSHPTDSSMWKAANLQHPEFAQESRNVRLGISIDEFTPFGNCNDPKYPTSVV